MNRIIFLNLEWNNCNGFCFDFISIDTYKYFNIDASLFGINVSKDFLIIDIFYFTITIFDKYNTLNK